MWWECEFTRPPLSSLTSMNQPQITTDTLRCWAEVDHAALRHNLSTLRSHVPQAAMLAVVKANAYGHGLAAVVGTLAWGVDFFGVANLAEAREIARVAPRTPVLLLGAALPVERAAVVREGFIPAISSVAEAAAYATLGPRVAVHLAVDTGMGRMGVWEADALETARQILAMPNLQITGLCSHLPVADEDDTYTREQLARFYALVEKLRALGLHDATVHVENSAGIIGFPTQAGGLVRAGLALYGVSPRPEFQARLLPALTWKTRVLLVREYAAGQGVSYGRTFIAPTPMRVATLAVGYADGYPRQASGRGASVLIRGQHCAVLGRVTMDQIMVDVTALAAIQPGEIAVLLGQQDGAEISATELAKWGGTIAWDIFTGIGQRVARVHLGESAVS